jgi:plastocyanin
MKARSWWILAAAVVLSLGLAACGGGDDSGDGGGGETGAETGGGATGGGDATMLTVTAAVNASNDGFTETTLSAPADTPFTIHFVNQDEGIPHNVQIFEGTDTSAEPVWAPADNALITGPDEAMYEIPALPAGTYTFNCLSHPTTMVGTLTVG